MSLSDTHGDLEHSHLPGEDFGGAVGRVADGNSAGGQEAGWEAGDQLCLLRTIKE